MPAFLPRTPFVCPIDGKNPNRFFPGDPEGTFSEVLDDAIFRTVITPSDGRSTVLLLTPYDQPAEPAGLLHRPLDHPGYPDGPRQGRT